MKHKLLTLVLVVACTGCLKAQSEFAPLGATWYYGNSESMFGDMGFTMTTVTDTSIIGGKKVKVLVSEYHGSNGGVTPRDTVYAYQIGDSVLFFCDGDFHLVYNFGLNEGDTMEIYNPDNKFCGADMLYGHVVVESIKTLNINGILLKEFNFVPADTHSGYYHYIEKIGTTSHLFGEDCIADNFGSGIFGSLRCYDDLEIEHYQYGNEVCDSIYTFDWDAYNKWQKEQISDIIDKENMELNLFYSQSDKAIVVDSRNSCESCIFKVFDVNGRLVYSDVCEPENQKYVAISKRGIYMVFINNSIGIYYEKIIAY